MNVLFESPLGALLARPWLDVAGLFGLRRYMPLSRLWAADRACTAFAPRRRLAPLERSRSRGRPSDCGNRHRLATARSCPLPLGFHRSVKRTAPRAGQAHGDQRPLN